MDCERIAGAFASDFRIENLTKRQREILRGIYPEKGNYEFIKNNLKNPTFDERLN